MAKKTPQPADEFDFNTNLANAAGPGPDPANLAAELDDQFGSWDDIESKVSAAQVPSGKAIVQITNAFFTKANSGKNLFRAIIKILQHEKGDAYVGVSLTKNWNLSTKENLAWLKTDLENLDIKPPVSFADLRDRITPALTGKVLQVAFVENADPQYGPNVYINAGATNVDSSYLDADANTANAETDAF